MPVSRGAYSMLSTTKAKQYLLSERRQTSNFFGVETTRFYSMPKLENFFNHKAKIIIETA